MHRTRAYSDPTSPPLLPLTESSLAQILSDPHSHIWPSPYEHLPYNGRVTPSTTSVSDGEDGDGDGDGDGEIAEEPIGWTLTSEQVQDWVGKGKGKGKGKVGDRSVGGDEFMRGSDLAGSLPPEILIHIFRLLPDTRDLLSILLVSRTWCLCAFSVLWHKPTFTKMYQLIMLNRVLKMKDPGLPYALAIRRLNLAGFAGSLSDETLQPLSHCSRVERLTLTGATDVSSEVLKEVIMGMPALGALDLSYVEAVEEEVMVQIAKTCGKLQGLNLSGCKFAVDEGMKEIAKRCRMLRRVKLGGCHRLTDASLVVLAESCPQLLEIDLAQVPQLSNATLHAIFLNSCHLRELRLNGNVNLSNDGIPDLPAILDMSESEAERAASWYPWFAVQNDPSGIRTLRRPLSHTFEHLRLVDLTGCSGLGDLAIDHLVTNAPKLRNLTLAKCEGLSDPAVERIGRLGKHLHYLHLGHVSSITDAAVTKMARSCTRLRYIDLACCPLLTNLSIFELAANMPKLRRIGLVKVVNLTDEGVQALVERHSSLERIHLSYCEQVSVKAVTFLLNRLMRLTHLSLTGVPAFKTQELQQFCRPAPDEFNEHQQAAFCVYSGHGVTALRNYLNARQTANQAGSDDASTRRGSGSSTSSITVPGGGSGTPPPLPPVTRHLHQVEPYVHRRGSSTALRENLPHPGLGTAFATNTPNFLSMPGAYSQNTTRYQAQRVSRDSSTSTSSVPDTEERLRPAGPRYPGSVSGSGSGSAWVNRASTGNIYARQPGESSGTGTGTGTDHARGSTSQTRRSSEVGASSPLRWVAGMVGWRGGVGEGEGPKGERR